MADPDERLRGVTASARAWLEAEAAMGGIGVPVTHARARAPEAVSPVADVPPVHRTLAATSRAAGDATGRLRVIAERAAHCTSCGLHASRNKSVFARGSDSAELVFVGEGPGRDEDASGEPFVGAAGQLLDKMVAAMGFRRDEIYVCNVVKCRPPENRTPLTSEAAACEPFLTAQLEIVAPKVIVALGKCAAVNLGVAGETGSWRGVWGERRGVPVMPTYHPAYLLRSPDRKREVWDDLRSVLARLGRPLPAKPAR